jgi:predicted transcriptional regulator
MPGRRKKMSDKEIVDAVRRHPDRAVTAKELAEELDFTSQGLLKRLHELNEGGPIRGKKVGGGAIVWWVEEDQTSAANSRPASSSQ